MIADRSLDPREAHGVAYLAMFEDELEEFVPEIELPSKVTARAFPGCGSGYGARTATRVAAASAMTTAPWHEPCLAVQVRADVIEFTERGEVEMAEVLIALEESDWARQWVIEELRVKESLEDERS
jgi:hypothetical protein